MLTSRMKQTITLVLQAEGYITLKEISEKLNVSTRTLLRESDSLETWVQKNDGEFVRKKGSGIAVAGDREEKERLLALLNDTVSNVIFSPEQRSIIIRSELLQSDEPMKLYSLAVLLDVVESTISSDLLQIESWFEGYGIRLIRRQGLGILLKAEEKALRKAIVSLIHEQMSIGYFMEYLRLGNRPKPKTELQRRINKSLFGLLDIENMKEVALLIQSIGHELGFNYADNAFMVLTLRFCVTIKRKSHWGQSLLDYDYRETLRKDRIYKTFVLWLKDHQDTDLAAMPEEELLYLTMHLKGSKLRDAMNNSKVSMIEDFRTIQLAKEFIIAVEKETGIYLSDNEELVFGLVKHLRPAIYRMKMELDFINPLLMEIKEMYPKLFLAIRKCARILEEKEEIYVPDDEVAYLATHIGAVIQKSDRDVVKKFQVVLACMYGIGASQLLVANIEKNFKNIDIVNVISVMDYKMNRFEFDYVDLVISTIPMDTGDTPCIVVNPVFKQEDVMEISGFLKNYTPQKRLMALQNTLHLREKLINLQAYNEIIVSIIDEFEYEKDIDVKNMTQVIEYASGSIGHTQDEKAVLTKAFELREEKGSTILSKKGMMLLHCRANVTSKISLKMFQLKEPIAVEHMGGDQPIVSIVVMVGPSEVNQQILDVLSEISRAIITSEFADMILSGDGKRTEFELHRILDVYYQKLSSTL